MKKDVSNRNDAQIKKKLKKKLTYFSDCADTVYIFNIVGMYVDHQVRRAAYCV